MRNITLSMALAVFGAAGTAVAMDTPASPQGAVPVRTVQLAQTTGVDFPSDLDREYFKSLGGLPRGMSVDDVIALLGEPDSRKDRSGGGVRLSYLDGLVLVSARNPALGVNFIRIGAENARNEFPLEARDRIVAFFEERGLNDFKLNVLGHHYDDVLAAVPKPTYLMGPGGDTSLQSMFIVHQLEYFSRNYSKLLIKCHREEKTCKQITIAYIY